MSSLSTAGVLEGVGQDRHPVERPLLVNALASTSTVVVRHAGSKSPVERVPKISRMRHALAQVESGPVPHRPLDTHSSHTSGCTRP